MAVQFKLPDANKLVDCQFLQVPQGCGLLAGFQFDKATNTFYAKESQIIIPSHHGFTHVSDDPVPLATCDTQGLMSADDKCKLDSMLQTRLGVLGFQGSGFPDDGGFLVGDVILAAGSEFIQLERIGNTIRFTVDSPIPLNCGCESCSQIFWVVDESEPHAIRPPSCNGKMPDVTAYGELKIYSLPENTIVDVRNPLATLKTKGQYPSLLFKRYANAITPFENEFDVILKRNVNHTTNVGWTMTPGPKRVAECVWWMGNQTDGKQIKFELLPELAPGLLGSLLFQGNLITKKPAVIVDYTQNVLKDNIYMLRAWDVNNANPIGTKFTARNVWKYLNPENNANSITDPKTLALDSMVTVLPIGTLVDIYEYEISRNSGNRVVRSFFIKEPSLNPAQLWSLADSIRFGDLLTAREEINNPVAGTAITANDIDTADTRLFEKSQWGITNLEDRLILFDDGQVALDSSGSKLYEPSGTPINNDIVADIDYSLPGMRVLLQEKPFVGDINGDGNIDTEDLRIFACAYGSKVGDSNYNVECDFNKDGIVDVRDLAIIAQHFDLSIEKVINRPIFLWNRRNHSNMYIKSQIGMPEKAAQLYPPYDFLLDAPVDSYDDTYMKVVRRGVISVGPFAGAPYIVIKGQHWHDLPAQGVIRILTGAFRHIIWKYYFKTAFFGDEGVTLIGRDIIFPFDEDFPIEDAAIDCSFASFTQVSDITADRGVVDVPTNTTVIELLHQDYSAPAVRFQFDTNYSTGLEAVQLQIVVGILDMSVPYPLNVSNNPADDYVRGFAPGFTVSRVLVQSGFITDGIGADVKSTPPEFRCYKGGELPIPTMGMTEKWNDVEILFKDGQCWIWFNGMLISPDTKLSSKLPSPVAVNTPYFPLRPFIPVGKFAMRMFPGANMRSVEVRDQLIAYSEFSKQQLQLIS